MTNDKDYKITFFPFEPPDPSVKMGPTGTASFKKSREVQINPVYERPEDNPFFVRKEKKS